MLVNFGNGNLINVLNRYNIYSFNIRVMNTYIFKCNNYNLT